MSREINFANVNVSIQEFQKLSKGDYNAGEVKLSSETKLTKINNHVHLLRANNKTLSHTEIMVIKDAFIRALSDNGVSQAEINRVRKELGLAPADSHDSTLAERSLRPLSRQQIRRILDRNAAAINAHTGADTIQTSAQMYGNMSVGKSERIRAKRDAAFDSTEARRTLTENRNIALYQRTLVGDTDFLSQADREFALTCAKSQRNLILRNSNNNPSAERECELVFLTQSGAHVSVASGTSETETLRRLDEQILRLTNSPAPSDEIIAMRNELLAVGAHSPAEHKNLVRNDNWLRGVGNGGQANQRGRTALVILLQERGINDFKTLSLVNHLQPAFVHMALDSLINRYADYYGDDLRNTPLMGLLVEHGARHEQVPEQEATYIPVLSPEVRNEAIANMLISDDPQRFIMNDFVKMAGECHAEAVAHFGADFAAMTDSVHGLADDAAIRAFCDAETAAGREVTADSLRATFRDSSLKSSADKFVTDAFKPLLQEAGNKSVDASAKELVGVLKNMHPALQQQIIDAGNPVAAREVLNGLADEMRGMAQRCTTVTEMRNGELTRMLNECLADELGLADMAFSAKSVNFSNQAADILAELSEQIESGAHAAKTPDEIRAAFREKASAAAHERAELLKHVDTMGLPVRYADSIKTIIATAASIRGIDLDAMSAKIDGLQLRAYLDVFAAADGADEGLIFGATNGLNAELTMVGVQNDAVEPIMIQLFAAKHPEVSGEFEVFFARPEVQEKMAAIGTENEKPLVSTALPFLALVPNSANNAAVIDSLGKGSMSPFFAKALIAAVDDAGFAALPLAEKISLFAQNKDLGVQLRDACKGLPANVELQPHNLKEIAAGLIDAMDKTGLRTRLDAYNAYRGIVEAPAIAAGYDKSEISSLCDTFRLYKGATGCSDEEALRTVLNTQSDARRLYGFGGRFTSSVENFGKGLHLQEQFRDWFSATVDVIKAHRENPKAQFPAGASVTAINGDYFFMNEKTSFALEKFIFDEIASNAALPLEHEDPEQVFGMANNPATRLVARGYVISSVQTLLQIPPQIRGVVYKVLDLAHPIRQNVEEPLQKTFYSNTPTFLARIIKHLDEIQTMQANGTLTYENFVNLAFSEVPDAVNKSMYEVLDWYTLHILQDVIPNQLNGDMAAIPSILGAMNSSGCSLAEAIEAVKENRTMPSLPYMASVATGLDEVNGNWDSGRKALLADMVRPANATIVRTGEAAIPSENAVFTVGFPDGTTLKTRHNNVSKEDTQASAEAIADKVEQFVGGSHPDQLNAVLFNLSQSGMAVMREGLVSYGVYTTEHAPMTYILSQDKTTGTINIHYQQPEGFPIKYHWDTEVTLDGTSISTSIVVEGSV